MLQLQDLHTFSAVAIQCHDNPDADAIACAFALGRYFERRGTPVKLFYAGPRAISKPNLMLFIEALSIPLHFTGDGVRHVGALFPDSASTLLVTVDCQYGAGNVRRVDGGAVCVIDHHIKEKDLAQMEHIEPHLGSCSTVVWKLLRQAGFDCNANPDVATALYYGLYTDTNSFAELFHPADRDMIDELLFDAKLVKLLKGCNLSREELLIAGKALHTTQYDETLGTAIFEADPCDPNILGFISDLALQVKNVNVTVGFSPLGNGVKLSLRSATPAVMANELADRLTEGCGSGGGNREKAGGFFHLPEGEESAMNFIGSRLAGYFAAYDTIVAGEYIPDTSAMRRYTKKNLPLGYVRLTDLYPEGTDVVVRTLEGDADFVVSPDTYLMIGVQGETYPISREKFEKTYVEEEGTFAFMPAVMTEDFYTPTVKDKEHFVSRELLPHARPCGGSGRNVIHARPLARATKVFTPWYTEGYMYGKPGDYLAARGDDTADVYIIAASIFAISYDPVME